MLVGILLGDGPSRQNHWQVSKYKGKPVLKHTLDAMCASRLDYVILVLGRDYHLILNRIEIPSDRVKILMNHRFDRGLSSYLKMGLMSIPENTGGVMVVPGEYPQLTPDILNQLMNVFQKNNRGIIVPVNDEERGVPVIYHRNFLGNLKRVIKDDTGLSLLNKYPGEVIQEEILSGAVVNSFGKIRTTETSEIENLIFSKFEKDKSEKKRNDAKVAVLEARKASAVPLRINEEKELKTEPAEEQPEPENVQTDVSSPVTKIQEAPELKETPKEQPVAGEIEVPRMERNKKQIIDKLKQKIEARVKEEKQKIIDRRVKENEPVKSQPQRPPQVDGRQNFRPSERPMEVPRHHKPQAVPKAPPTAPMRQSGERPAAAPKRESESKGADTGKLDQAPAHADKNEKNLSLKMLNDLLGRGKDKK